MYLRAGVLSLGLLLLSRVLGLARESVQAAAFGVTGLGDVVIVMFTLPDLLVGILINGALAYVLLPYWAMQNGAQKNASQKRLAKALLLTGVGIGICMGLFRDFLVHMLAPGLTGPLRELGAVSIGWSALVLPLATLAALWTTRLQHERDFVGMYASNLMVNVVLVGALLVVSLAGWGVSGITALGMSLVLAMLARLGWLGWRLSPPNSGAAALAQAGDQGLPAASVWIWAALSSGLLLLLPLAGRSLASQGGEGALASFNYAWKLVELPLILAVQTMASIAFPAIAATHSGTPGREQALSVAFSLAWGLACAAVAIVATFSLPLAGFLFGWGRIGADHLEVIARWSAIGIWSLLPQALIAVLLTTMAISRRMHVAVWAYLAALAMLLLSGLPGAVSLADAWGLEHGAAVMWMLNVVLAGVVLVLMIAERSPVKTSFPWLSCAAALAVTTVLVSLKPFVSGRSILFTMIASCVYGMLVLGSAVMANPQLRKLLFSRLRRTASL